MALQLWIDQMRHDAAYAIRGLRRSPGFTTAVVLTLGLGIGVNATMFSLLDRIFLQPPAGVWRPSDIRRAYTDLSGGGLTHFVSPKLSYPQYRALRSGVDSSIALGLFTTPDSTAVIDAGARIPARVSHVTPSYFSTLGVRAAVGRLFSADEGEIATPTPVAVLSDAFWRRTYDGDRSVVGRRVMIDHQQVVIVGIGPPEFSGIDLDAADVWLPANTYSPSGPASGPWYEGLAGSFGVITRLTSAARETQLLTGGTTAIRSVQVVGSGYDPTIKLLSGPIIQALGPMKQANELVVATRVAAVALMVLIIACANVTNLLLLRAAKRRREIAVRRALGVSRIRLAEQFTIESLVLAAAGGTVAIVFALWAGVVLRRIVFPRIHWAGWPIDAQTIGFVAAVSILVGLVAGLAPAFDAMRPDLVESLKAGMRQGAYRSSKLRAVLLAIQTGLSVVLLVGAGLFTRSLNNVRSIGVGYETDNRIFLHPEFDDALGHDTELRSLLPEVTTRLRQIDGVRAVGSSSRVPIGGAMFMSIFLPGRDSVPQLPGDYGPSITSVSPDFFKAGGLRLKSGREFSDDDRADAPRVAIVGESMARLYWPGESALDKCIMIRKRDAPCTRVVGVASDAHRRGIVEATIAQFYVPLAQMPFAPRVLIVQTRAGRGPATVRAAEQILRSVGLPITGLTARTFESILEPELRPWRLGATLFTALGALALAVAAVGVYSVVAYGSSQRTQEMGVRIALGAQRRDILDLVLGDGLRVVAIGIAGGVVAALLLGRFVASLMFGVVPADPAVLIGATCILCVAASIACLIPGWRASAVDPSSALRAD